MAAGKANISERMALPAPSLTLAVTGHRDTNPEYDANKDDIRKVLSEIFALIDALTETARTTRLHSLLAQGADLMAVELALERDWEVFAPLPFGKALNVAINAHPETEAEARALLAGKGASDAAVQARANRIMAVIDQVKLFELAEQDELVAQAYFKMLSAPEQPSAKQAFAALGSKRAAMAARVMIEHSSIMIAIWNGTTLGSVGGTRHSMALALEHGTPVIWINASDPESWTLLRTAESLASASCQASDRREQDLRTLVDEALADPSSEPGGEGFEALLEEKWHGRSNIFYHGYRRVEALFGGRPGRSRFGSLVQVYETPDEIEKGSAAAMLSAIRSLPSGNSKVSEEIVPQLLRRFAWADGVSTHLSDAYRGSMVTNFILSAVAVVGGIAYLPLGHLAVKWPFALFEFIVLLLILVATFIGRKKQWHSRWFETRRVAEYLRHAPILIILGVARAPWRWPQGANTSWPEHYARNMFQQIGLPKIAITTAYLRCILDEILMVHVLGQRDYHSAKAERLTKAHHNLDRMSEICFILAVISVGCFLSLAGAAVLGVIPHYTVEASSKFFTVLGVLFPTLGGLFAGIRFFGDFERFAAISEVTAKKLDAVQQRIAILLMAPNEMLQFDQVAELAHAVDDIVIDEIENWQAVFGGKQISVPV